MYSRQNLFKKIKYAQETNDEERLAKYFAMLKEKNERMRETCISLQEVLELKDFKVHFSVGLSKFTIIINREELDYSLKLGGSKRPSEMRASDFRRTPQYKRMIALGFSTLNFRLFHHDNLDLGISLYNSTIRKIRFEDKEIDSFILSSENIRGDKHGKKDI